MILDDLLIYARRLRHGYHFKNWKERRRNRKLLEKARAADSSFSDGEPLVSIVTPTYNRSTILAERAIPSVLGQTYQNFEMIVVGDHCTDNTKDLIETFNDKRIKFFNLPERGEYPVSPYYRWLVAGTIPTNKALDLASGQWIAHLDDDDEFSPGHIEVLLRAAIEKRYEMVYGILQMEKKAGEWTDVGSYPPSHGKICHSSVMFSSKLKFLRYDPEAWKFLEPCDWNLWRRMIEAGVRVGFVNTIIGKHHLERTQWGR